MATFTGTSGNDSFTGTASDDTFNMFQGGDDTVQGLGGNDIFSFGATLTSADSIDGGIGNDTLRLVGDYSAGVTMGATTMVNVEAIQLGAGFNYNLTTDDANVAAAAQLAVDAHNLAAANHLTFNGAAETDGTFRFTDGAGNDVLTGGAGADSFNMIYGGEDTVHGGGGNDVVNMKAQLDASDNIDGGAGSDTVNIEGSYSGAKALVFTQTTLTNVETLQLLGAFVYNITVTDGNVAAGQQMQINAGTAVALTFNDGQEHDGSYHVIASAGNDNLFGGGHGDTWDIGTGEDIVNAVSGDTLILARGNLDNGDRISGGTLVLNGDYSAGLTLASSTLHNVEELRFAGGHDYDIVENNGNLVNSSMTIDATPQFAADSATFDGSHENDSFFVFDGGAGTDNFSGGVGGDTFNMQTAGTYTLHGGGGTDTFNLGANFTGADTVDGGTARNVVELAGGATAVFTATTMTNIQELDIGNSDVTTSLTTNDATVAAGQTMLINTFGFTSNTEVVHFDGSAETDGHFQFDIHPTTGSTYIGGAQSDTFTILDGGTTLTGGGGGDAFRFQGAFLATTTLDYNAASDSTSTGYDSSALDSDIVYHVSGIGGAITGIDSTVSGALSTATFDTDLGTAVGAGQLAAHHAMEFHATSGTLSGHYFMVIDTNGTAGYQAGGDLVVDLGSFGVGSHPAALSLSFFS